MPDSAPNHQRVDPNLRPIETGDAAALCRLANMPGHARGFICMPFESTEFWSRKIANTAFDDTWIVAELGQELVGHGRLLSKKLPRVSHVGEIALGVADDHVGRGIGSAILKALLDVADNWRGLKRVELTVLADNETAIQLYRRHGFEVEGRLVNAAFTDGRYMDILVMARLRF